MLQTARPAPPLEPATRHGVRGWLVAGRFVPMIAGGEGPPPAALPPVPQPAGGPPAEPPPGGEAMIPKARFDEINAELKRLRKAQDDAERERQEREDAAAREQGKFRELAEKHEKRVQELEPAVAKAERYEAALRAHLDTQRKDLPAPITALLDRLDVAEQLEWLAANRDAVSAGAPAGGSGRAGNTPAPKPAGPTTDADAANAEYARLRTQPAYSGGF